MTPEQLVEKMADEIIQYVEESDARIMLRVVLQAIKDGGVCRVTNECGEGCCWGVELKPEFEKFLKGDAC